MINYIILGFLIKKDMTGYEIKQAINMSIAFFYNASFGSIYPALGRLKKLNFISSKNTVSKGKHKITYSINQKGKEYFNKWVETPFDDYKFGFLHLVKVFFMNNTNKEKAVKLLEDIVLKLEKYLKDLKKIEPQVNKIADFCQGSTLEYGIYYYKFTIKWYKNLISSLRGQS
ncbi:MAG: PadR family transcriptional regulator [Candidatus Firestonebacteria bacterium]